MSQSTPADLVATISSMPSLPAIYVRLSEAIDDPNSSMRKIETVVHDDPSLAGRLLRLANSAYFGFPAKVDSISRAITLVGTRQLRDLSLATSVMALFKGVSPQYVTMDSFWRHAVACGLVARALASWRREPNPERFFVAGLLHDIGRLVLYLKRPQEMSKALDAARERVEPLYELETDVLGYNHAAVGGELLKQWNLPASLAAAVAWHHAPGGAGIDKAAAATVHVADVIANAIGSGSSGESRVPALSASAWEMLELQDSVVAQTLLLVQQQLQETFDTLMGEPA